MFTHKSVPSTFVSGSTSLDDIRKKTERKRETDGQTERERGKEDAVLCEKEGTSLIDLCRTC